MGEKPYDEMTHDEILEEHGKLYAQLTPQQRARLAAERDREMREANLPRNKKLGDLTLGEMTDEIGRIGGKLLNKLALYVLLVFALVWFLRFIGLVH